MVISLIGNVGRKIVVHSIEGPFQVDMLRSAVQVHILDVNFGSNFTSDSGRVVHGHAVMVLSNSCQINFILVFVPNGVGCRTIFDEVRLRSVFASCDIIDVEFDT